MTIILLGLSIIKDISIALFYTVGVVYLFKSKNIRLISFVLTMCFLALIIPDQTFTGQLLYFNICLTGLYVIYLTKQESNIISYIKRT